jgi:hypothetical protein
MLLDIPGCFYLSAYIDKESRWSNLHSFLRHVPVNSFDWFLWLYQYLLLAVLFCSALLCSALLCSDAIITFLVRHFLSYDCLEESKLYLHRYFSWTPLSYDNSLHLNLEVLSSIQGKDTGYLDYDLFVALQLSFDLATTTSLQFIFSSPPSIVFPAYIK